MLVALFIVNCQLSITWSVDIYVDPDASGNDDGTSYPDAYDTLQEALAEDLDLVTLTEGCTIHVRSLSGTDDTTAIDFSGWTINDTYYPTIVGEDFPADGVWDDDGYILHSNNGTPNFFTVGVQKAVFRNLQFQLTTDQATERRLIFVNGQTSGASITFDRCLFKGPGNVTGERVLGIYFADADAGGVVTNCVFWNWGGNGNSNANRAISIDDGAPSIINNSFWNNSVGIRPFSGSAVITNNVILDSTDDIFGTGVASVTFNTTDDGDGSSGQSPHAGGEFSNTGGLDFSLTALANSVNNGTASGAPALDLIGTSRPQGAAVDIGAVEYVAVQQRFLMGVAQ